eukprot:g66931.t1
MHRLALRADHSRNRIILWRGSLAMRQDPRTVRQVSTPKYPLKIWQHIQLKQTGSTTHRGQPHARLISWDAVASCWLRGSPVGLPQITPRNELPRWLSVLWDAGVTPISLVRALGPAGPCLVRQVSRLRWGHVLNPEQLKATASYIWHVNAGPPCADIAIVRLLRAGAWPRKAIAPLLIRLQVPMTFLYGDLDWMGYHHSLPVVDGIHGQYQRYSPASEHTALLTANKPEAARVYIVEQADHQLFMTAGEQIANALIHDFERLTLSADKFAQAKIKTLARANADRVVIHNMIGERNASTAPLPNVTPPAFAGSADAVSGQERMAAAGNAFICEPLHNVHGALFLLPSQGPPLPPSHHRHNRRDFERR